MTSVPYFRSGCSRVTELQGYADAGSPVGIVIGEASARVLGLARDYVNRGGLLFVDSGAFSAFRKGRRLDFAEVLEAYLELARSIDPERRRGLSVVAPDVIGDAEASRLELARHRDQVAALIDLGVRVIVPLQLAAGDIVADRLDDLDDLLGLSYYLGDYAVGLPLNAAAMTDDVLAEVAWCAPGDVHLLGMGPRNRRYARVLEALRAEAPDALVTCDSNKLAAQIGSDRILGRRIRQRVETERAELADRLANLQAYVRREEIAELEIRERLAVRAA